MSKRPNIVIFNPDSYRADVLRHLGNAGAVTPNLDAILDKGGVSYSNAFAQNPVCTPSRCSFMTGWYLHTCGHRSMKNMLKEYEPNLLSVLCREDYFVWWGGKNDLFAVESADDYLKYCDIKYKVTNPGKTATFANPVGKDDHRYGVYYQGVMTHQEKEENPYYGHDHGYALGAADFIENYDKDQPFCIFLTLSNPHPAYKVEDDFYNMIDPEKIPPRHPVPERDLPVLDKLRESQGGNQLSDDDWLEIKRVYYAMCTKVDYFFGLVVDALEKKGIYDDTLIFFLSDHGDFAGDYALPEKTHCSLQDCLIQSPLVIKPPAEFGAKPGIRTHLAELVDMTATIYDMLDIEPGYDSFGKSLCNSLHGCNDEIRDAVFAEVGARKGERQFKNLDVQQLDPDSFYAVQGSCALPAHDAGSYAISTRTQQYKYIRRGYVDHHELYDLANDPGEINNLSGSPDYEHVERQMATLLLNHFMTTADVMPHQQDSRKV